MTQRRDYIDELKGFGILLVVAGHFIEQYRMNFSLVSALFFCIYAFHMALFCICSGLVARFSPRKLVTQQLWLYLVGQTLMLAFRAAVLRENFAETGGLLSAWLLPWRHMWYLYALLFWHLTLPVLTWLRDKGGVFGSCLGMAAACGLALAGGLTEWPFTLVRVVSFFPFYAFGVLFRPQLDALAGYAAAHRGARRAVTVGLLAVYGAYFVGVLLTEPIMDSSAWLFHDVSYAGGDNPVYRVVFYAVGIATTAALAAVASGLHGFAVLGRHTLAIYLLHLPILALCAEPLQLFEPLRGGPAVLALLWALALAGGTVAVLNLPPIQRAFDFVGNCWYKRKV
ncbi:acyltransferase family protein [Gemmiger sp.]